MSQVAKLPSCRFKLAIILPQPLRVLGFQVYTITLAFWFWSQEFISGSTHKSVASWHISSQVVENLRPFLPVLCIPWHKSKGTRWGKRCSRRSLQGKRNMQKRKPNIHPKILELSYFDAFLNKNNYNSIIPITNSKRFDRLFGNSTVLFIFLQTMDLTRDDTKKKEKTDPNKERKLQWQKLHTG